MKYKVGDEVRIKGTDIGGTIESIIRGQLIVETKGSKIPVWPEEVVLIEGLVEEETALNKWTGLKVDENGNVINTTKIVLEKKKKKYPKTYGYCCDTLDCCSYNVGFDRCETPYDVTLHNMLLALRKLIVCRDAYWKIAGEEMGLGRSWKPNDSSGYCTYAILRHTGHIRKSRPCADSGLLEFPTEEMRDAFYENFKKEIEICKELL